MDNMEDKVAETISNIRKEAAKAMVSVALPGGSLAEMVYRPEENRTLFCVSKDGGLRYESTCW
jgi:hypothetical protein